MTRIKFTFLLVALCCMQVTCAFARPGIQPDEKTMTHLKKFREDYVRSMLDQKPELIAGYYAEEVRLMPEFQQTVMGKSNALSYYKAFAARFTVQQWGREEVEILDLGSRIVELGLFTTRMTLKSTNQPYELKGKYQNVWEKSENGTLSLITEAWNYNHQVEIAQQLKFGEVPSVQIAHQAHLPVKNNISFELTALNRLMEMAFTHHDAKLMAQFYTEDAMFIYSYNPIYRGRKALDAFLDQHMQEMPIFEKLDCRTDRIDVAGDYVIEYASHVANWRNGESSGVSTGKNLRIWRRENDCSLKLFRQMAMYD
jgi:ketosteroid isomerase-like protein